MGYVGRSGSSTLVRLNGERYICTTKHEIGNNADYALFLDNVRVVTSENGITKNIPFDQTYVVNGHDDEEVSDLILLRVAGYEHFPQADLPYFMPLKKFDEKAVRHSVFVACPILSNQMHLCKDGKLEHFNWVSIMKDCNHDRNYKSYARDFDRYHYEPNTNIQENGCSGGAVYSLVQQNDHIELMLHGIILRAGNGFIYTLNYELLLDFERLLANKNHHPNR